MPMAGSKPDLHYMHPRLAALYDRLSGWSPDRTFYLELAGARPQRILDLGCGTGLICNAYAGRGHRVTGADPASAMLEIARNSPRGRDIEWVQSTAEAFRSDARFDLIVMTGHAFQVLLDDAAIAATFAVVRRQLAAGGAFVFESRNPMVDWAARWAYGETELEAGGERITETRHFISRDGEFASFEHSYEFADERLVSTSTLRFAPRATIEALLATARLRVEQLFGDWNRAPFAPEGSDEMIFIARAE